MSLRNKLFLWITTLLLLAGLSTFILEVVITDKEIQQTKEQLTKKIIDINENKRKQIEEFLASAISENQAKIDVLLERLSSYPLQASAFAPTQFNSAHGTWLSASEILHSNKWIDFIQNTNQGKLSSLIIPKISAIDKSVRFEISEDLAWILMGDLSKHPEPYLGLRLRFNASGATIHRNPSEVVETTGKVPRAYLLFPWQKILFPDEMRLKSPLFTGIVPPFQINLNAPWADGSKFDPGKFFETFSLARKFLQQESGSLEGNTNEKIKTWIQKQIEEGKTAPPLKGMLPLHDHPSFYIKKERASQLIATQLRYH
ncbi:MAG: hypothetical protein HYZ48_05040 [Chlamydiales bacterium]|nr:hypothetical protein [Chlamydiales bacterium]